MLTPDHRRATELRETYLADVSESLKNRLKPVDVFESVNELRSHLDSSAAAHAELGASPEAAMMDAIRKFGSARRVGAQLALAAAGGRRPLTKHQAMGFTLIATWAAAFILVEAINLSFVLMFGGYALPAAIDMEIALVLGVIFTFVAWMVRRFKPLVLGAVAAILLNLGIGPTLYPAYLAADEPKLLAHFAISLTASIFLLGVASSAAARHFDGRTPARRRLRLSV